MRIVEDHDRKRQAPGSCLLAVYSVRHHLEPASAARPNSLRTEIARSSLHVQSLQTFSSLRFPGLARDEIVTGKYAIVGVSARRRVRHFQSGPARGVYVGASYNAGRFEGRDNVSRFGETIHGLGVGLSLDLRYAGPLRFEAGRTNTGGVRTYLSLGRQF